jgi:hypothetical protein
VEGGEGVRSHTQREREKDKGERERERERERGGGWGRGTGRAWVLRQAWETGAVAGVRENV